MKKMLLHRRRCNGGYVGEVSEKLPDGQLEHICFTLELPWLDNKHNVSCIPTGTYTCQKHPTFKIGYLPAIEVKDVPGRDGILIHVGNKLEDTHGCLLPGASTLNDTPAVLYSRQAMKWLLCRVKDEPFELEITQDDTLYKSVIEELTNG